VTFVVSPNNLAFSGDVVQSGALELGVILVIAVIAFDILVSVGHLFVLVNNAPVEEIINATFS
jgi:hypothetical protein